MYSPQKQKISVPMVGFNASNMTTVSVAINYRGCMIAPPETFVPHGCTLHPITEALYCQIKNLHVNVDEVACSQGGDNLTLAFHNKDKDERRSFPKYGSGALTIDSPLDLPASKSSGFTQLHYAHYLKDVLKAITVVNNTGSCIITFSGPTMFITRYEYVNLYHTMTDWFDAFLVRPPDGNVSVVFLDGHAEGDLDSVWEKMFGKVLRIKHIPSTACFEQAIFIPPGYSAPIWKQGRYKINPCPEMMSAFEQFVVTSFGLQDLPVKQGLVTIIDRVPYMAHPGSNIQQAERVIHNLHELQSALEHEFQGRIQVELIRLEALEFGSQVALIRQSQFLIGNHGAGLSHLLFMQPQTHVMEFHRNLEMFKEFAEWKPQVTYHKLPMVFQNLREDQISDVVDKVRQHL